MSSRPGSFLKERLQIQHCAKNRGQILMTLSKKKILFSLQSVSTYCLKMIELFVVDVINRELSGMFRICEKSWLTLTMAVLLCVHIKASRIVLSRQRLRSLCSFSRYWRVFVAFCAQYGKKKKNQYLVNECRLLLLCKCMFDGGPTSLSSEKPIQ